MAKHLKIVAHQVQIPKQEKDDSNIFDLKFDKAFSLIQENLKSSKTERTMILVKQDLHIHWIPSDLDRRGGYSGTEFKEDYMNDHHSVMGCRLQEFENGTHPFAACHIKVFKTDCAAPAEHYILFHLPEKASDTRFILKMIEKKAITRNILVHVDIITTNRDKSEELAAIMVEMKRRLFEVPEFLSESALRQMYLQEIAAKLHEEEQEAARLREEEEVAARLREERKRRRRPSRESNYDFKLNADGKLVVPARCVMEEEDSMSEDSSSEQEEESKQVRERDHDSEDECIHD